MKFNSFKSQIIP